MPSTSEAPAQSLLLLPFSRVSHHPGTFITVAEGDLGIRLECCLYFLTRESVR